MNISTITKDKLNSRKHNPSEIQYIVSRYTNGIISDLDMTGWLKAVYNHGMSLEETVDYTSSIIDSGNKVIFKNPKGYIVDKHSTGGVGDKVSLILGPILAACGCYVPMIVGRSLGHTGGTLDKLESINGYNGLLSIDNFKNIVEDVGISIIGQTDEVCPADRKIYQLRDKTNTIASFPLICGSIMSKKIAEGIQGLVLDVKVGNGAFMDSIDQANSLGLFLSTVSNHFGVAFEFVPTDMNQPLGKYSGLLCEVVESLDMLRGGGNKNLLDVVFSLGNSALSMAGIEDTQRKMQQVIDNGSAFEILSKMIYLHGGDIKSINLGAKYKFDIASYTSGIINYQNTKLIGQLVNELTLNLKGIDPHAGIQFHFSEGDYINKGDPICTILSSYEDNIIHSENIIQSSITIS